MATSFNASPDMQVARSYELGIPIDISLSDTIILGVLLIGALAYSTKGSLWGVEKQSSFKPFCDEDDKDDARNFVTKMHESRARCIIFYGSQTGTAETFASRLAVEANRRFGLVTMVANLEDYDLIHLDSLPANRLAIFVLASFGDGEPTDNAVDFYRLVTDESTVFSQSRETRLDNLQYAAFGLGDRSYEFFNAMVRKVDAALNRLGAQRIGEVGEGDDGAGTMEEDYISWKENMWAAASQRLGLEERTVTYDPSFEIEAATHLTTDSPGVWLGEVNKVHLAVELEPPFNSHNPFIAPVTNAQELFRSEERSCLHLEIDLKSSGLTYEAGDHVAVWPMNPDEEVNRLLELLDLWEERHQVISVRSLGATESPFQSPTTYDTILRYYLDICGPVSRQLVSSLTEFSPSDEVREEMQRLGADKDYFHQRTHGRLFSITRLLSEVAQGEKWTDIPFTFWVESFSRVQPRYYSISSSPSHKPGTISITSLVTSEIISGGHGTFFGLATNYLSAVKENLTGHVSLKHSTPTYEILGPRGKYRGTHVPIHIRHTKFRLPSDPTRPIIMVGAGTGVAPFRGFIQERSKQAQNGVAVGRSLLFFGCRKSTEDFLYASEWEEHKGILGEKFELVSSLSRDGSEKKYVQHRLKERAAEICELLSQCGYFYVCGDAANMAREVSATLGSILAESRGVPAESGGDIIKTMKASSHYQEDVW